MIQYAAKRPANLDYLDSHYHRDMFLSATRWCLWDRWPCPHVSCRERPLMRSPGPREEVCTELAKEFRRHTPNEPPQWTWWFSVWPWTVNKLALSIHLLSDVAERVDMLFLTILNKCLVNQIREQTSPITSQPKYKTFLNSKWKQFAFPKTYHLQFLLDVLLPVGCGHRFKLQAPHP